MFEPQLFDVLEQVVRSGCQKVAPLEDANLLPDSIYFSEQIPTGATPKETAALRQKWLAHCRAQLTDCNLVFLDPDNGLEPKHFGLGNKKGCKSVSLKALPALQAARSDAGGVSSSHSPHRATPRRIAIRAPRLHQQGFERVDALRAKPFSPQTFFLLDADDEIRNRAATLAKRWEGLISWYGDGVNPGGGEGSATSNFLPKSSDQNAMFAYTPES